MRRRAAASSSSAVRWLTQTWPIPGAGLREHLLDLGEVRARGERQVHGDALEPRRAGAR